MEIIYDNLLFPKCVLCNSLMQWHEIFAGYEIDFGKKNHHYLSLKLFFSDILIFLAPNGAGETSVFCRKTYSRFYLGNLQHSSCKLVFSIRI